MQIGSNLGLLDLFLTAEVSSPHPWHCRLQADSRTLIELSKGRRDCLSPVPAVRCTTRYRPVGGKHWSGQRFTLNHCLISLYPKSRHPLSSNLIQWNLRDRPHGHVSTVKERVLLICISLRLRFVDSYPFISYNKAGL